MRTQLTHSIGNAIHIGAFCSTVIAALLFGFSFATEKQLAYQIDRFVLGGENLTLIVYLGLLLSVFIGYFLADRKRISAAGNLLVIALVGLTFAWCQMSLNFLPGPFLAAIAAPAAMHVLATRLTLPSEETEASNTDAAAEGVMDPAASEAALSRSVA